MKILLAHSDKKLPARESIDLWRVIRPFRELAKHVDWQIDHVPYLLPDEILDKDSRAQVDSIARYLETLADYDIIWTSYFPDAVLFDTISFICERYGIKLVVDCDDDMYHIPKDNGIWKSAGEKGIRELQWMVEQAPYLVTTNPTLQATFAEHREQRPTYVLPNYIGSDYKHKPFDNGEQVVISFFGSLTHKRDMMQTGFIDALQEIMHKYKPVYCGTVGLPIDAYLPKQRYSFCPGKPGQAYLNEVWPNINADIAVAPLIDDQFNNCRSNIKWLEAAMIPAAFVASNVSPYKESVQNGKTGMLVENTSAAWYNALEALVLDAEKRTTLAAAARKEVLANWSIQHKWQEVKALVEQIAS